MPELARRLASPSRRLTLAALKDEWFTAKIIIRIPGCAMLAHDVRLLRRIRGGIGNVLLESASPEAVAGNPCRWNPPCGLDVFFREQGRFGPHGIPKPYVLAADRSGQDLVVTMTLFGFAADWSSVAAHAFVTTLQQRIDWRGQRTDVFIPRVALSDVTVRSHQGVKAGLPSDRAELMFLTPMNAERDNPIERPGTLFARLARRIEGLALWHDAELDADWQHLGACWNSVEYDVGFLQGDHAARRSGRVQRSFVVPTVRGTLAMDGLTAELWSLLTIGTETHVGKGATEGFGRYIIT